MKFMVSIMTFALSVDCDADDTFEHVSVIHLPLVVNRNSNYVVVMAALVHNLDFVMLADPYRCQNIRVQAITNKNKQLFIN